MFAEKAEATDERLRQRFNERYGALTKQQKLDIDELQSMRQAMLYKLEFIEERAENRDKRREIRAARQRLEEAHFWATKVVAQ